MADSLVTEMKKADLIRAERIERLITSAREKAQEARTLLSQAHELASNDSYQTVTDYEAQDIKDVICALKVAATRPILQLELRWSDIVSGRKEHVRHD